MAVHVAQSLFLFLLIFTESHHRVDGCEWFGDNGAVCLLSLPSTYCSLTHLKVFNTDKPRNVDCSPNPQSLLPGSSLAQRLYFAGTTDCHNTCHQLMPCPCHPSIHRPVINASPPLGQLLLLQVPGEGSVLAWGCIYGRGEERLRGQKQRRCIKWLVK